MFPLAESMFPLAENMFPLGEYMFPLGENMFPLRETLFRSGPEPTLVAGTCLVGARTTFGRVAFVFASQSS